MAYTITQKYFNHFGVDLKSNEITRPAEFASDMLNSQYADNGSIVKRYGSKVVAAHAGGYGLFTYNQYNSSIDNQEGVILDGSQTPKLLTISDELYRYDETTFLVVYAGLESTCLFSLLLDATTQTFKATIFEGTTTVLDYDLGVGFDEAAPKTLANLKTQIDAIPGFTATITGTTTISAAFLDLVNGHDLVISNLTMSALIPVKVNCPIATPFATYYANRNNANHENVSAVQMNGIMYFGSGYDHTYKYDGQNLYRAGLPTPASVSAAIGAAGAITGNNYVWLIQYQQIDEAGNIIEGNYLESTTAINLAAQKGNVTIANIQASTGFNTNCAIINGAQFDVKVVNVDPGHTMKVGDTAYWWDSYGLIFNNAFTATVTAVTANTITLDIPNNGLGFVFTDNTVISANLRINVYRSKTSATRPTIFYLVGEIPNNSFAATQAFVDNIPDASLGALFNPPSTDRSPPPKGRYLGQWNNIMVIGGNPEEPNALSYSDIDFCEYFPAGFNQFFTESGEGDDIRGVKSNNEVFCDFGERSFAVVSGEIASGQIRLDYKALNVGALAHASIVPSEGELFWLSNKGPRRTLGGSTPAPLGVAGNDQNASRVDPIVDNSGKLPEEIFQFRRAVAANLGTEQKYLLYIPAETTTGGAVHPNSNSRIYVYDYARDAWLIWSDMNMAGGATSIDNDFYFLERRYSSFTGSVQSILYKRLKDYDDYNYADHQNAINASYYPQWESLGNPSVLKKFLNLRLTTIEDLLNNSFTLTVKQEFDYEQDAIVGEFEIETQNYGYGSAPYGSNPYGSSMASSFMHGLARQKARACRVSFHNNEIHENYVITGWELEVATPYRPELKP